MKVTATAHEPPCARWLDRRAASINYRDWMIGGVSGFATELPLGAMAANSARVRRIYVGSVAMLQALARAVALHRLRPIVDRTFGFSDAPAAIAALKQGAHFGKLVIDFAR